MNQLDNRQRWQIKTAAEVTNTDFDHWQQLVEQQHQGNLMLSGSFVQHLMQVFQPSYYLASCYQADELKVMLFITTGQIWHLAVGATFPGTISSDGRRPAFSDQILRCY